MQEVYFDWSLRRGVVAIIVNGNKSRTETWPNLGSMLDAIKGTPSLLVGESTFESYVTENRPLFVMRCKAEGHTLRTVPSRLTPRHRRSLGMEKSDENDARAIMHLAQDPSRLSVYHEPDWGKSDLRAVANKDLMLLRATGTKDAWARDLAGKLPPFADLPEVRRKALGDGNGGKNYNLVKLAAVAVAAKYADSQRGFDFLSGMYAHAYPSQIRADLMHWGWAGGSTRGKLKKERDPSFETDKDVPVVPSWRVDGLTLTDYRRELRWLYRQLREIV